MSSEGPNSAGTIISDDSVGTETWLNPTNADTDDSNFSDCNISVPPTSGGVTDYLVKLVKNGTVSGDNKGDDAFLTDVSYTTAKIYGGSSDLWGLSLTPSDINSSNFGFVFQAKLYYTDEFGSTTKYSEYLKFTNFGFSIPSGATISGIEVGIKDSNFGGGGSLLARVYYAYITVYYSYNSKIEGIQSVTGVGSITF